MIFKGAGVAISTPFVENGEINYKEMGRLIEFQLENKIDAVIVAGTTGEASTLTDEEQYELIKYTVEKVNKRVPVIAGAGSNNTNHGKNLALLAKKAGVDALLIVTPYYNKTSQRGLIQHMDEMIDAVGDLPIILYDVPGRTGMRIAPETVYELSKRDSIVGLKDAVGDIVHTLEVRRLVGDDFAIYSGNDDMIVPIMSVGGAGVISVLANCVPRETSEMCHDFLNGETEKALELQLKYKPFIDGLFADVNPVPVKAALELMGFDMGNPRAPLYRVDEKVFNLLKLRMKEVDLIEED